MAKRDEEIDFTHGMRVRVGGFQGRRGRILRCKRKPPQTGHYWKVKLDTGEWVWPTDVVSDTDGRLELRCQECGIRFRCHESEPFCPACDNRQDMVRSYEEPEVRHSKAYLAELQRRQRLRETGAQDPRPLPPLPATDKPSAVTMTDDEIDDYIPF